MGLNVQTAQDGAEGFDLICKVKPHIRPILNLMNEIYMQDNICGYAPLDEKEQDEPARALEKAAAMQLVERGLEWLSAALRKKQFPSIKCNVFPPAAV